MDSPSKNSLLCVNILSPPFSFEVLHLLVSRGFTSLRRCSKEFLLLFRMPQKSPVGSKQQRELSDIARAKKQGQRAAQLATALLAVEAVRVEPSAAPVRPASGGKMHLLPLGSE